MHFFSYYDHVVDNQKRENGEKNKRFTKETKMASLAYILIEKLGKNDKNQ